MRPVRLLTLGIAATVALLVVLGAVLRFLAPALSYSVTERLAESLTGRDRRPYRIGLGVATGSYYRVGTILNRYLLERAGYELELVTTAGVPENVGALVDARHPVDLATIESSSDEATRVSGVVGLATIGRQYFFVMVPADSTVADVRDLTGRVNPGVRGEGQPATLGERVLQFYGLLTPVQGGAAPVTVVRPAGGSIRTDFESGHMDAATRTQFLNADLIETTLADGRYRLVPIRDHDALSRALPGTTAESIPAGSFGPARRIPAEPVPTLSVATVLVARSDLPARVASDILEVIYDPRFARDIQQPISEDTGRVVGGLPLHPAAAFFYARNDQVTSDRIGRISFVASTVAAVFALVQLVNRARDREGRRSRRRLLETELEKLTSIRRALAEANEESTRQLLVEADELLSRAEIDAAADRLDQAGIASLRSLHALCAASRWRAVRSASAEAEGRLRPDMMNAPRVPTTGPAAPPTGEVSR